MSETFNNLNLNPSLVEALSKENITVPTEIQSKVIPKVLENKDLIAQSETGTGKTLAYLLPVFEKLDTSKKEMQAMVLVPTHELAIQVIRQIERLSQNSNIKVNAAPIIGNVNITRQIEKLKEKPHILVGSPGRILELIKMKKISAYTIKTIVLDEGDRLMDENNLDIVKAVIKSTLKERQLMMFSATISKDTEVRAKEIMKEPEILRGEEKVSVPSTIEHTYYMVEQREKFEVLRKLVKILNPKKAIIFVNQGVEIQNVTEKLQFHGLNAESIQGSNVKLLRKKTMDGFRSGTLQLLVASDIAARGLHIDGITHIFNFSMPEDPKDYLHRVGRTGRNGNQGYAISIITERELTLIKMYENAFKISISSKDMYEGKIIDAKKRSSLKPTQKGN